MKQATLFDGARLTLEQAVEQGLDVQECSRIDTRIFCGYDIREGAGASCWGAGRLLPRSGWEVRC